MSFFDQMGTAYKKLMTPDPTAAMVSPNIQQAIDDGFIDERPALVGRRPDYLNRETPADTTPYQHEYKVASGDTLSRIARDNGTTVDALAELNGIEDVDSIAVGQDLLLSKKQTTEEVLPATEAEAESEVLPEAEAEVLLEAESEVLPEAEAEEESSSLFNSQSAKNLFSSFNPFQGVKTEEDYSPDVIESFKVVASNALSKGRMNIEYEDYGTGEDGEDTRDVVTNTEARKKEGGLSNLTSSSIRDAAMSVGGGTLVEEDGNIYLTDVYDFSRVKMPDLDSDKYYALRYTMGELSHLGLINEFKSKILLGSKKELLEQKIVTIQPNDTLSKIAKNNNTTLENLMSLNNISDKNKIKAGDRLRLA
jgi:LysM repeat protein